MVSHTWLMEKWQFNLPTKIIFGQGAAEEAAVEAKKFGKKVFMVVDEIIRKVGLLEKVEKPLRDNGFEIKYFTPEPEPRIETAKLVVETVREQKYDLVMGIGGGSSMDLAKVASIMATNPGEVTDYIGINLVQKPGIPKILMPTTAGTGAEVTPNAILASSVEENKTAIVSPYNFADVAIVDPLMTLTMPPKVTAVTGLDALTHAVEAYMSIRSNPLTDAIAYKAIQLISTYLPVAYADGENIEARSYMSLAALMAGIAICHAGTCAGHAAAYAFAVKYKIPHGLSCAIALPYIMEYNAPVQLSKHVSIAEAMNERVSNLNAREAASKAVRSIVKLMNELDVPYRLKDIGVSKEDLPKLVEGMLKNTRLLKNNPRKVSKEDAVKIFERMWEGKLNAL